jgi:hypothetical protein
MNTQTIKRTSGRARSPHRDCSDDKCPAGARNNYYLGKHLTPASYRLEQSHTFERRRLINRAIHGWGVVYGFALAVTAAGGKNRLEPGELGIGEGLALDRLGRELIQMHGIALTLDNLLILDEDGRPVRVDGRDLDQRLDGLSCNPEQCWLLSAHYAEQKIGLVTLKDPCSCDREEWDQTCETIVYSLRRIDCDACCMPWTCELRCCCAPDTPCCEERGRDREELSRERRALAEEYEKRALEVRDDPAALARLQAEYEPRFEELARRRITVEDKDHPRGGCACLCEHLTGLDFGGDCARLIDVDDCTHADLANGIALACLRLARDECGSWAIGTIVDACGPRRLVKRNDLLFDLINGCDVTRISEIGWAPWHRREQPVPFDAFVAALGWPAGDSGFEEYPTRDFWVRFSRPVRADTLTPDAFAVVVMSDHGDDFWRRSYRVPILAIDTDLVTPETGDPPGHVRSAKLVVSTAWLENMVNDADTIFAMGETRVEIEVRGDFIEDCLGQTVDANPRGRSAFPSGSDGPGDSYLSAFTVARRIRPRRSQTPAPTKRRRSPTTS